MVEGVDGLGEQQWEGTAVPLPPHPWFEQPQLPRVSSSSCPAGKGLPGYSIPQPTINLVSSMAPSPEWG